MAALLNFIQFDATDRVGLAVYSPFVSMRPPLLSDAIGDPSANSLRSSLASSLPIVPELEWRVESAKTMCH